MTTRLTYLGHACLLIEMGGVRLLMDPWLVGPCEGNGWWHLPAAGSTPEALGHVDYIMISHIHDDHFHQPTLERLPKTATVIISYGVDHWMGDVIREWGFGRVMELDHARRVTLPEGIEVENYQVGRIDSAFWLRHANETILNLNDCPTSASWCNEWLRHHSRPDIALGAFSYASPFPICYDCGEEDHAQLLAESTERVVQQFADTMGVLRPRYAVPFATQFAFLLPNERWMNSPMPTPVLALGALADRHPEINGVLLDPGDRLSVRDGKSRGGPPFDWRHREREIDTVAEARRGEIARALAEEPAPPPDFFERFAAYFERIVSRNWLLRRKVGLDVAFVPQPGGERWIVRCRRRRNVVSRSVDARAPIEIQLPGSLLYAAIDGRLHWETLYLSNRLRVTLDRGHLGREWDFWRMLFNFRDGMLRDRLQWFTPRGLRVLRHRYSEILRLLRERLVGRSNREPYSQPDTAATTDRAV